MSGHSKWHTIKHKKGAADAKRGKLFTRIIKELTVAARAGGGDPDTNPRLRTIVAEAKSVNMPADNIKRAIERATGAGADAEQYEEITYEGIGPANVAVIVAAMTDNRNRTASEIRSVFNKVGGTLSTVAWQFEQKGVISIPLNGRDPDELTLAAIDAGAADVGTPEWAAALFRGESVQTLTKDTPSAMRALLEAQGITAHIFVPVFVGGAWWGFIGFDQCGPPRLWDAAEVDVLRLRPDPREVDAPAPARHGRGPPGAMSCRRCRCW